MAASNSKSEAGNNEIILTAEGIRKLEEELEELKTKKRKEVAERIKVAIAFGDISENSEYDEAKNEQAFVEGKIIQLENMLRMARVVDSDSINTEVVNVGNIVTVRDMEFDEEETYTIVGNTEADFTQNKISPESPVGSALLGASVGSVVSVSTPAGVLKFEVVSIKR